MKNQLRQLRDKKGLKVGQAAELFGMSLSGYQKIERGERRLSSAMIEKACSVYGVAESEVMGTLNAVSLVGFVGAGNAAHYYGNGDNPNEDVDRPPQSTESTVAVQVKGDSMYPLADDGDLIYFDEVRTPPTEDQFGKLCVVGLSDDRILIKRMVQAREPGRFDLLSLNASPMLNVHIAWSARVKWIKPK